MGKSKRVVTLKTACVCGRLGAIWVGKNLYCSNRDCQCLIREKGQSRISGSKPVAVPETNEGSSWNPQPAVEQERIFDPDLAKSLFRRFGCGNGHICGNCYKCI